MKRSCLPEYTLVQGTARICPIYRSVGGEMKIKRVYLLCLVEPVNFV